MEQCNIKRGMYSNRQERIKHLQGFLKCASLNGYDLSVKGLCTKYFGAFTKATARTIQRDLKFLKENGVFEKTVEFFKGKTRFFRVRFFQFLKNAYVFFKKDHKVSKSNNYTSRSNKNDNKISNRQSNLKKLTKKLKNNPDISKKKYDLLKDCLTELEQNGFKKPYLEAFIYAFKASLTVKVKNFTGFYLHILRNTDFRIDKSHLTEILKKEDIHKHIKIRKLQQYDIFKERTIESFYCNLDDYRRFKNTHFSNYAFSDVFFSSEIVAPSSSSRLNNTSNNNINNKQSINNSKNIAKHDDVCSFFGKLRQNLVKNQKNLEKSLNFS